MFNIYFYAIIAFQKEKYNSELEDIEMQREMLIQEKNQLEEFLSTTFNPTDILFVAYFNFGNLVVNAFHFYKDGQNCNHDAIKLYKSINDKKTNFVEIERISLRKCYVKQK